MSRPRLILHIGSHKTGTTAIQAALAADRGRLADAGVIYPETPWFGGTTVAHHGVAHALARPNPWNRLRLARFFHMIRKGGGARWTVLSAEPFWRYADGRITDWESYFAGHRRYLGRLRDALGTFEVTCLAYLRRPDALAVSAYKEGVARGWQRRPFGDVALLEPWTLGYAARETLYRALFDDLALVRYEVAAAEGLVAGLYRRLDIPPPDRRAPVRPSLSDRGALWLARAQRERPRRRMGHSFRFLFATEAPGRALFASERPTTLWPDPTVFARFLDLHAESYACWGGALPDPPEADPAEWSDPDHARAEAAFSHWEANNRARLTARARAGRAFFEAD